VTVETPQPRYQQLAAILRSAIESGDYAPGSTLEPETTLAARYDVDRRTVNRAVLSLRAEGLVRVERGNRTVVRELPVLTRDAAVRFRIRDEGGARGAYQAELARHGLEARSVVEVTEEPPPDNVAGLLGTGPREPVLTRARRMYAGDIPVQLATSWLPLDLAAGTQLQEEDTGPGGSYSRLADLGHGPAAFTESIRVRPPGGDERLWLRLDIEQRVYFIRRIARDDDGRVVEVTDTVLPAHQWELTYTWPA
jgi:GntR family transcriptional regulator